MPLSELLHWAETELKPKAELAAKGEGEFSAGEHCRFCKRKATCRKRAEYNLQLARYDFAMPDKLTDAEIEAILETADQLVAWASDIKEYALQQSLQGKTWKNWKLVEGRARRAYCSETAAAEAVQAAGFDPYEHKVLGITAMTRMLGKKKFEELLGDLLVKPQGKPTLVPLSDKRPVWNTAVQRFPHHSEVGHENHREDSCRHSGSLRGRSRQAERQQQVRSTADFPQDTASGRRFGATGR